MLSKNKLNIKELAEELNLSDAIITKHVAKLEATGLIKTERIQGESGIQKVSSLTVDRIEVNFPKKFLMRFKHMKS